MLGGRGRVKEGERERERESGREGQTCAGLNSFFITRINLDLIF